MIVYYMVLKKPKTKHSHDLGLFPLIHRQQDQHDLMKEINLVQRKEAHRKISIN